MTEKTVTIKVKYDDFTQITRSISPINTIRDSKDMLLVLPGLIDKTELGARPCRLLGVSVSNFVDEVQEKKKQYVLFG